MKYTGSLLLSTALTLSSLAAAEDVLVSRRMQKRFIDADGNYNISFYHINDVHAHLDEFRSSGTDCDNPARGCFGGYARIKTVIDDTRPGHNDSLFLNAGDEFQGTLFYSFYGGEKIAETINQLGFDALTLGNHEFDAGDDALGAFLNNLTFPILGANINSTHPILSQKIKPYHIFEKYDLAVIGVTTDETPDISSPGDGTTFSDPIKAVQDTIDLIKSTTNITRIAALTHIGYEEDQKLGRETKGLHLIMGGHSHTPLGNMSNAAGTYPTIVENQDGDEVFIVTAYRWGEYLGYIDVTYDPSGKILAYNGAPIHITNATEQDPELQKQIDDWRGPFEVFAAEVLGQSAVELDQSRCRAGECVLGNFMADAMLAYRRNNSDTADFALINSGGIRATIDVGPITRGEVLTSFPFGNAIVEIEVTGEELWKTLEGVYTEVNQYNNRIVTSKIQVSRGINITYNSNNANGSRLVSIDLEGQEFSNTTTYNVVTLDFLAGGGDNIFQKKSEFATLDTQDEVLVQYVQSQSPVNIGIEGRIRNINGSSGATPTQSGGASASGTGAPSSTGTSTSGAMGSQSFGLGSLVVAVFGAVMLL